MPGCSWQQHVRPARSNAPQSRHGSGDGLWFLQVPGDLCPLAFQGEELEVLINWASSLHAMSWQFSAQGHCRRAQAVPAAFCPDSLHAAEEQMFLALSPG